METSILSSHQYQLRYCGLAELLAARVPIRERRGLFLPSV
uniref:Uncharacterized protein n=1 Tax=Anguilla anguilla TaxID=7936 RepID=A0A0E9WCH3_ANGAN